MTARFISRRALLTGGAATYGGLMLTGCDRLSQAPDFQRFLGGAEGLTQTSQRFLLSGGQLAREFRPDQMSPVFKTNGSISANDNPAYVALMEGGFADYRLQVDGLVSNPLSLSLADLRRLPQRTQITRHDCVEGWSAIGQWTGVPLGLVLKTAGLAPNARFAVFHCADDPERSGDMSRRYYESVDLIDAFHPQTILAHTMNGEPLSVPHGAPVRMRIERQLGYKHAKFVMRIEMTDSLAGFGRGKGGFWEDRGYEWYAGI
jgi:DMSO/TMAO reductase YedYZ molybdopterin-dependent catalytic subunit